MSMLEKWKCNDMTVEMHEYNNGKERMGIVEKNRGYAKVEKNGRM